MALATRRIFTAALIKGLGKSPGSQIKKRPVSIEIVQFGRDPDTTLKLRRLDDGMLVESVP